MWCAGPKVFRSFAKLAVDVGHPPRIWLFRPPRLAARISADAPSGLRHREHPKTMILLVTAMSALLPPRGVGAPLGDPVYLWVR